MIRTIDWPTIEYIWQNYLWPNRQSRIETNSAMCYHSEYNMYNMATTPTFFGYYIGKELAGVNSGHMCINNEYRSRGLWVDPKHRGNGIGQQLLLATIEQARKEDARFVWSYPRKSSCATYQSAGFKITSEWQPSETSEENAYCILNLKS